MHADPKRAARGRGRGDPTCPWGLCSSAGRGVGDGAAHLRSCLRRGSCPSSRSCRYHLHPSPGGCLGMLRPSQLPGTRSLQIPARSCPRPASRLQAGADKTPIGQQFGRHARDQHGVVRGGRASPRSQPRSPLVVSIWSKKSPSITQTSTILSLIMARFPGQGTEGEGGEGGK